MYAEYNLPFCKYTIMSSGIGYYTKNQVAFTRNMKNEYSRK